MDKVVDYFQAMRDFDKSQGKKTDDFDMLLKSSEENGEVDYLVVSRVFEQHLIEDHSDVIHIRE